MEFNHAIHDLPQILFLLWIIWIILKKIVALSPMFGKENYENSFFPTNKSDEKDEIKAQQSTTTSTVDTKSSEAASTCTIISEEQGHSVDIDEQVLRERQAVIENPLTPDMNTALIEFERNYTCSSNFRFHDFSPLACYGYRVGTTRGLPEKVRREIIFRTWHAPMPKALPKSYTYEWGKAGTYIRYEKILKHIEMLAKQRAHRSGYEVAVSHWISDANWLKKNHQRTAKNYFSAGYK